MTRADRLRGVLDGLARLLDDHRDALWAAIDHRDAAAVEAGTARYRDFLERAAAFRDAADRLADALADGPEPAPAPIREPAAGPLPVPLRDGARSVRRLDPAAERPLDTPLTHTRPAAIRIEGTRHAVDTWRRAYELVCQHIAARDPERFARLPTHPQFVSPRDRHDFSRRPQDLRAPSAVADGVFAETHFSADELRNRIRRLLDAFGLPHTAVGLYLRADRPA